MLDGYDAAMPWAITKYPYPPAPYRQTPRNYASNERNTRTRPYGAGKHLGMTTDDSRNNPHPHPN